MILGIVAAAKPSKAPLNCAEISKLAGAGSRIRTDDLLITNQLLYQLSYASTNFMISKTHSACTGEAEGGAATARPKNCGL